MKCNLNINNLPEENASPQNDIQPVNKEEPLSTNKKPTELNNFIHQMCRTYSEWEKTKEAHSLAKSIKEIPEFIRFKITTVQNTTNQYSFKNILPQLLYSEKLKIGSGGFGSVFYGKNSKDTEKYAIKIQNSQNLSDNIIKDTTLLQKLKTYEGFPKVYYYGSYKKNKVLAMDLLGPSMDKVFKYCDKKFSIQTVALLGQEMLTRIESMHLLGILHRDIKPNNFSFDTVNVVCSFVLPILSSFLWLRQIYTQQYNVYVLPLSMVILEDLDCVKVTDENILVLLSGGKISFVFS